MTLISNIVKTIKLTFIALLIMPCLLLLSPNGANAVTAIDIKNKTSSFNAKKIELNGLLTNGTISTHNGPDILLSIAGDHEPLKGLEVYPSTVTH